MYYLTGDAYPGDGTPIGDGNTYVTSIDINTGTVKQVPVLTKAGSTLHHREPEGLAIYRPDAGEARLFIGLRHRRGGRPALQHLLQERAGLSHVRPGGRSLAASWDEQPQHAL